MRNHGLFREKGGVKDEGKGNLLLYCVTLRLITVLLESYFLLSSRYFISFCSLNHLLM
jgi:hypothetical protein